MNGRCGSACSRSCSATERTASRVRVAVPKVIGSGRAQSMLTVGVSGAAGEWFGVVPKKCRWEHAALGQVSPPLPLDRDLPTGHVSLTGCSVARRCAHCSTETQRENELSCVAFFVCSVLHPPTDLHTVTRCSGPSGSASLRTARCTQMPQGSARLKRRVSWVCLRVRWRAGLEPRAVRTDGFHRHHVGRVCSAATGTRYPCILDQNSAICGPAHCCAKRINSTTHRQVAATTARPRKPREKTFLSRKEKADRDFSAELKVKKKQGGQSREASKS